MHVASHTYSHYTNYIQSEWWIASLHRDNETRNKLWSIRAMQSARASHAMWFFLSISNRFRSGGVNGRAFWVGLIEIQLKDASPRFPTVDYQCLDWACFWLRLRSSRTRTCLAGNSLISSAAWMRGLFLQGCHDVRFRKFVLGWIFDYLYCYYYYRFIVEWTSTMVKWKDTTHV